MHAPKVLDVVRVVKRVGVLATIVAPPQVVVIALVVSRVLMLHEATNLLQIAASALLPRAATNPLLPGARNRLPHVAISPLPRVVKSLTRLAVKNRLVTAATHLAVTNPMPHAARILTRMRAVSLVRLSPVQSAVTRIVRPMPVNRLVQRVILHHVQPPQVVKPSHHAAMVRRERVLHAQARHAQRLAHAVALPLTAVAVKS